MCCGGSTFAAAGGFDHAGLIYRSVDEFLLGAVPYVRAGVRAGEPVLVRVDASNLGPLREALGQDATGADIEPAEGWYENPALTRSKLARWVARHTDGSRVRFLGEPPWPLGSDAGVREWARHEAILNLAFAGRPISFVCSYDARTLPPSILEHAASTHPEIRDAGGVRPSSRYVEPGHYCRRLDAEVSTPSGPPRARLVVRPEHLDHVRRLVEREASAAGLPADRVGELVCAVNEVASNAVVHGAGPAAIRIWTEPGGIVCEVVDLGPGPDDRLVGQLGPRDTRGNGWGLWMARMMCDTIEFRPGATRNSVAVYASAAL